MSSAKKYSVVDGPQRRRRKKCVPLSICEIMFCDWDYEVDADDDAADEAADAERKAQIEANGEGYYDGYTNGGPTTKEDPETPASTLNARNAKTSEMSEEDDEEMSVKQGTQFSKLRDSLGTKHNSPLRKIKMVDGEDTTMQREKSRNSVLDIIHHEEEEESLEESLEEGGGEPAAARVGTNGEDVETLGEEDDAAGDWRDGKRPPHLMMPHSPPGTSPARPEGEGEGEREEENVGGGGAASAATAAPLPGAVNEEYDRESLSSTTGRLEQVGEQEEAGTAPSSSGTGMGTVMVGEGSVEEQRRELSIMPPEPEYGARAIADRDAGLTPSKALKQLVGDQSDSYERLRGRLGVEEELQKNLDEVLKPVDEMSTFLSQQHNLFTPYMDMPKSLLLPYSNYEAYGQPRTFSTAPGGGSGGGLPGVAGVAGGVVGAVGDATVGGGGVGGGGGGSAIGSPNASGVGGASISNGGGGGVATPSWMGPK